MVDKNWKSNVRRKKSRQSSATGKSKGLVPPPLAKYLAKSSRSYKHPMYMNWSNKCQGGKVKWKGV